MPRRGISPPFGIFNLGGIFHPDLLVMSFLLNAARQREYANSDAAARTAHLTIWLSRSFEYVRLFNAPRAIPARSEMNSAADSLPKIMEASIFIIPQKR